MYKGVVLSFCTALIFIWGCNDPKTIGDAAGPSASTQGTTPAPDDPAPAPDNRRDASGTTLSTLSDTIGPEKLSPFIPEGYMLMDWAAGDLNRDAYPDAVLIVKQPNEADVEDPMDNPAPRPVILLLGDAGNQLSQAARCDRVALCVECGGVFGDPYEGIAIKDGYFSIEHYGGSNWRWTRIITFKYVEKERTWYLHKDGGVSYHTSNPDDMEENVRSEKDFGKVKFTDYDYEKI